MAQLNKTTIDGGLTIQNVEDKNGKTIALQLPEGSTIYVGDNIFTTDWEENGSGENTKPAIMQGFYEDEDKEKTRVSSAIIFNDLENNRAEGDYSHAEGCLTDDYNGNMSRGSTAIGRASHAEGAGTLAKGYYSHAEGKLSESIGTASHAEGIEYYFYTEDNRRFGGITSAYGNASHAEGAGTLANADGTHSEGVATEAGRDYDLNDDSFLDKLIEDAVALGLIKRSDINNLSDEDIQVLVTKLIGYGAHSEGIATRALGTSSHAEGNLTEALANSTHSEGDTTVAFGEASHSEGYLTRAEGNQSHAEGKQTKAIGNSSHAEGAHTEAKGYCSHASGITTKANGMASSAMGLLTIADEYQTVVGYSNEEIKYTNNTKADAIFIVGNGSKDEKDSNYIRNNAFVVYANGDISINGIRFKATQNGLEVVEE